MSKANKHQIFCSFQCRLVKEEKREIEDYIAVGLEYGSNPHQGQNPEEAFPLLYEYLQKETPSVASTDVNN